MVKVIKESPSRLGYDFIQPSYLPPGKDEYWQRFSQNTRDDYRRLTSREIEILVLNNNLSGNWDDIRVTDTFNPNLVVNCRFWGLVRIGDMEESWLQYHDLRLPSGLYDSTIISCDLGDRISLRNVRYLSHYIIGNDTILFNIDEMTTTDHSKFGNGIIMEGEDEAVRVSVEVANEKGTRGILPFEGILPGDGWLWSKFRDRRVIQESFRRWTDGMFPHERGRYGSVGNNSVIKSCRIIKDVKVGEAAYIKGANKLKNLTLDSSEDQPVQIGEGVELVNGIVGRGARIFYGVKAIRFILGEGSQLKYGARLINSYLGENSTISCCEVLNALIFPFHEQHHNNSFLIASTIMGQSNMAAGTTVGSNHNSRGSDGEIVAERGFWPGLNVSLKHNSRFAPYTLLSKGAYPAELDIQLPFSLLSNDESSGRLVIMPGYWFFYNMYAMARNSWKYRSRDKRKKKTQHIEFDYLAPDSMEAVLVGRKLLEEWCGLENLMNEEFDPSDIILDKNLIEKGRRPVRIVRPARAWRLYGRLAEYYFALNLVNSRDDFSSLDELASLLEGGTRQKWYSLGSQLVSQKQLEDLESDMTSKKLDSWADLHKRYEKWGVLYSKEKLRHSAACCFDYYGSRELTVEMLETLMDRAQATADEFLAVTRSSREKDFTQYHRLMTFDTEAERKEVVGDMEEDSFIAAMTNERSVLAIGVEKFLHTVCGQS